MLYTNVLEALLRFVAVSAGAMLLHSACLELDGRGILLSARDRHRQDRHRAALLREQGARFLSDDMTILHSDGRASCFPKPLTISHHTLRAVQAGDLTPGGVAAAAAAEPAALQGGPRVRAWCWRGSTSRSWASTR